MTWPPVRRPLIKSLFAGPNDDELAIATASPTIPRETQLLSTRSSGDVLFVDVTPEITELSGELLVLAVAQIVFTATEIDGVRARSASRVDGQDQRWPKGDGETSDGALTVYDYPGLVQSAQPPYPGGAVADRALSRPSTTSRRLSEEDLGDVVVERQVDRRVSGRRSR